jgi:hypothetical protein
MVAVVVRFRLHAIARLNTLRLVRRVQRRQEAGKKRKHYAALSGYPQVIFSGAVRFSELGLVGHIQEESETPMVHEIWHRMEAEASAHLRE